MLQTKTKVGLHSATRKAPPTATRHFATMRLNAVLCGNGDMGERVKAGSTAIVDAVSPTCVLEQKSGRRYVCHSPDL